MGHVNFEHVKNMVVENVILLVEDSEDIVCSVKQILVTCRLRSPLRVAGNAIDAMDYLEGAGRYRNREVFPLPGIVLLDLTLPGVDGFELLSWIRQRPSLKTLRVIVLVSPDSIRDARLAYQLGADSFLVKPSDLTDPASFLQAVRPVVVFQPEALPEPAPLALSR